MCKYVKYQHLVVVGFIPKTVMQVIYFMLGNGYLFQVSFLESRNMLFLYYEHSFFFF